MTSQEIQALITCFDRSTARTMRVVHGAFTLELTRDTAAPAPLPVPTAVPEPETEHQEPAVTAPLVGTFYAAPAPDQPPFVVPGDVVKKGQTLCLLEAMKMMSEIAAPCDCRITQVLKANGEMTAFGEPLFRYEPC